MLRFAAPPEEISDEVLLERVRFRDAVARLMNNDDFELFRQHVKLKISEKKDALAEMKIEKFTGPDAVKLQGRIIGEQEALNRLATAIWDGDEAEHKLKTRREKSAG